MRPTERPIPRFVADTTQEGIPHGRFAERLREEFAKAVEEMKAAGVHITNSREILHREARQDTLQEKQ